MVPMFFPFNADDSRELQKWHVTCYHTLYNKNLKGGDFVKKVLSLVVALLFVLSVAGLSIAADEKKAAPAEAKKEAAPAKAEAKKEAAPAAKAEAKKAPAKVQQVTGEVTAVDAKANTLTVKGAKGDVALTADKATVKIGKDKKSLADVKVGDKVTVKFSEADGKNVAKSVAVAAAKAEKKAEKKEEKKAAAPAETKKEAAPAAKPAEKK